MPRLTFCIIAFSIIEMSASRGKALWRVQTDHCCVMDTIHQHPKCQWQTYRSGRPRVTTAAQDRYIRVRHLRDRTTTATSTAAQIPGDGRISDQTVRNRLREAGLFARRPVQRNVLTAHHEAECLQWLPSVKFLFWKSIFMLHWLLKGFWQS